MIELAGDRLPPKGARIQSAAFGPRLESWPSGELLGLAILQAPVKILAMNLLERITITPGRRSGKPCIRDSRITVYDVLGYLASGMTEEEILRDFPDLTHEDVLACFAFAAERDRKTFVSHAA